MDSSISKRAPLGDDPSAAGLIAGLGTLALLVLLDTRLLDETTAIVGSYVASPFVTAFLAGPRATAVVGFAATLAAVLSPAWNMNAAGDADYVVRALVVAGGSVLAVASAWVRHRSASRADRLWLLDAVGGVADGSLPLSETLARVVEVVVPSAADICMIDSIHDGRVNRIAVRAQGRDGAEEIEARMRTRAPNLPPWLVRVERPWRRLPHWMPRVSDEELRRMAHSPEDLAFLRSLEINSTIVVPIAARDRNLGALTLISAWSGRGYSADDVRFAQILASRIGLALDNAGLFSDLESVERRMDTVMSILDEAVVIHGPDGELVYANPAAARTLGFETSEQAISTPTAKIRERYSIHDERGRELGAEALSGRRALSGAPVEPLIMRVVDRRSGLERWMRTKSRAIENAQGEPLYSLTAIEDVTDVKRAEFAQRVLARTGELVAHSGDPSRMLDQVPRLVVPEFADWCVVAQPRPDGLSELVAVTHRDPEKLRLVERLMERYHASVDDGHLGHEVTRTGEARLVTIEGDMALHSAARDEDHLEILLGLRLGSAIVVPMSAAGRVVGTVTFCNARSSRLFDEDDLELAIEIGRRCGLAIEGARVADERARVAEALQRELLPPSLPAMPGWELATMYEPGGELNEVGGDFYEVFAIERGWAVVLGDVSGRGAAAASITAEARHTIRTAGALSNDPCAGLRLLDQNLRGREDAALCSVAVLVLPHDPDVGVVEVFLAGHPHPVLISRGTAETVGDPGPLLGVIENAHWRGQQVEIGPGDQLVLYTDGVIEAQGADGERFGIERLRTGLAGSTTPADAVARVRSELAAFGVTARQDDSAVVAVRCGSDSHPARFVAGSRVTSSSSAAS